MEVSWIAITYEDKCTTALVQCSDTLLLIHLRDNEERIAWRGNTLLSPQLHSSFCKFQRILVEASVACRPAQRMHLEAYRKETLDTSCHTASGQGHYGRCILILRCVRLLTFR